MHFGTPLPSGESNMDWVPSSSVLLLVSKTSHVKINCCSGSVSDPGTHQTQTGYAFPDFFCPLSGPKKQDLVSAVKNEAPAPTLFAVRGK